MQARVPWIICTGIVPLDQDLLLLSGSEQRQVCDVSLRVRRGSCKQCLPMSNHSLDSLWIKQVGVVGNGTKDAVVAIIHHNHQIEFRTAVTNFFRRKVPSKRKLGELRLLRERYLK